MSRLIFANFHANFSYLLGFCSEIDSQMHRYLRQVLAATRIRAREPCQARPRESESENKAALHARDPGLDLAEGDRHPESQPRSETSDRRSNRSLEGPCRKRCENRKEANIRTPEVLPDRIQTHLRRLAAERGRPGRLQLDHRKQIRRGPETDCVIEPVKANVAGQPGEERFLRQPKSNAQRQLWATVPIRHAAGSNRKSDWTVRRSTEPAKQLLRQQVRHEAGAIAAVFPPKLVQRPADPTITTINSTPGIKYPTPTKQFPIWRPAEREGKA